MREDVCNIFDAASIMSAEVVCVPTNGFVKRNGCAVMGAGLAKAVTRIYNNAEFELGQHLKEKGNVPGVLFEMEYARHVFMVVSFPVKPKLSALEEDLLPRFRRLAEARGNRPPFPGWMAQASIDLIRASAVRLLKMANEKKWRLVLLPRVGCGNGGLEWSRVRSVLDDVLDDRFMVVDLKGPEKVEEKVCQTGNVWPSDRIRVRLSSGREEDVSVMACYDRNVMPTGCIDLSDLKGKEALFVELRSGDRRLVHIGPEVKKLKRDAIVSVEYVNVRSI